MCSGPVLHVSRNAGQGGAILPLIAVSLAALFGFMALAIDVGYVMVARNELQNAADSAALAGADYLTAGNSIPNFSQATSNAGLAITNLKNAVAGTPITAGAVQTGAWDLTGSKKALQAYVANTGLAPAVQVTIKKSASNGLVKSFFGHILGISDFSPRGNAVAVGDIGVSTADANQLLPLTISQCLYDKYWDPVTQQPRLATSTTPLCTGCANQVIGQPYTFRISGNYSSAATGNCPSSGQWTSFATIDNSDAGLRALISSMNPTSLSIGDQLWIATGSMTSAYTDISNLGLPRAAFMAIVGGAIVPGSWASVSAFGCVKITNSVGGSSKYVEVQLLPVSTSTIAGANNSPPFICKIKGSGAIVNPYVVRSPALVNYYGDGW